MLLLLSLLLLLFVLRLFSLLLLFHDLHLISFILSPTFVDGDGQKSFLFLDSFGRRDNVLLFGLVDLFFLFLIDL